jgi:hypothetical protein
MFSHIVTFSFILLLIPSSVINIKYIPASQTDTRANTITNNNQSWVSIAMLDNGGFALVWESRQQTYDIRGQIFDNNSQMVGSEIAVLSSLAGDQTKPYAINIPGKNKFTFIWPDLTKDVIKMRLFDYSGNYVTDEITVSTVKSIGSSLIRGASNSLGNFFITWESNASGTTDVRGRFFNPDGTFLTDDILVNSTTQSSQQQPVACSLTNTNFVSFYQSDHLGNQNVFFKIYDSVGNTILKETIVNAITSGDHGTPCCTGLTGGGFVIAYQTAYWQKLFDITYRIYNSDGTPISTTDVKITTSASLLTSATKLQNGGFALGYSMTSSNDVYFQAFAFDGTVIFPETRVNVVTDYEQNMVKLGNFIDGRIVATWPSNNGTEWDVYYQIYNYIGDCYSFNKYTGINYFSQILFNNLSADITTVQISTLTSKGNVLNVNQNALDNKTFYQKTDIYYKTATASDDSFYYIASIGDIPCKVDIFMCYSSCKTCEAKGSFEDHKCSSCLDTYYPLADRTSQCFKKIQGPSGYYFDLIASVFSLCYKTCNTCTTQGDDNNNNCSSCLQGYSPLPDKITQCVVSSSIPTNSPICDPTGPNNCLNCNYNNRYYPLIDNNTICYRDIAQVPYYYFDDIKKVFQKCYSSCKTCTGYKDIYEQLCIKCRDNYYPLIDKSSNCFGSDQSVEGYYFDNTNNIFNKCYTTCLTCKGPGTFANPNCLTCKEGQSCDPCSRIIYNNQCITTCPNNTVYDEVNNTCYQCKDRLLYSLNGSCLEICPPGYYLSDFTCLTCQNNNKLVFEGKCVDTCPEAYIQDNDGVCVSRINQDVTCTDSACMGQLCTDDTCENGGVCSIQFNKITCTCTSSFTGQHCQIPNNNIDVTRGIISNGIIII